MTESTTPVGRALALAGVPHREFTHPGMVQSLEQAAEERGQLPEQVIRSILFRLNEGEYLLVLVSGPRQIPWKGLRRYLGTARMTMASEQEVLAVTGYPLGAVAPFGLPQPVRCLVDEGVFQAGEVSMGSGVRNTAVILTGEVLGGALGDVEKVNLYHSE